uniref:50S ribosomal protein L6 n=1 Tax=Polymyxa betae TaxID=41456 RepID=UPI001D12DF11|nr:50S ribosomal protein L6 [Polymyxa betae]CAG9644859.1 50S ribosomal protein L6 [Polymyxa betae]
MEHFFYSNLIPIRNNIVIYKVGSFLFIKGPLGKVFLDLPKIIFFEKTNQGCRLFGLVENKNLVLTYFKLLSNKFKGVYLGFFEILIINGVGWRVSVQNNILLFSLGYSHLIKYPLKDDIEIILYDKQRFKVFGLDLSIVQRVVADLCKLRLFNVYKGKGIYKEGQFIKLKESSKSKA